MRGEMVVAKWKKNLAVYLPRLQTWALSGFHQDEIETIARHVSEHIGTNPHHPLVSFSHALTEKVTNIPNRFSQNGEQFLLDRLSGLPLRTFFDVGANVGTWSRYALKIFSECELHAFEIVPETFAELSGNLPSRSNVHLNDFGLSDTNGSVVVHTYSSNLISSIYALPADNGVVSRLNCPVKRGAEYAGERGVTSIDVLKIDVEGAEGRVLAGFEPMISGGRIRLIQFEYNRGAILGNFLLKHAYEFFVPRGYRLGKLTPDGVHFHDYHFAHEDFIGPNYVACRSSDTQIVDRLTPMESR